MKITHSTYVELSAPLAVASAALCDCDAWVAPAIGAERLGELWRWGAELYAVQPQHDPAPTAPAPDAGWRQTLRWALTPVALAGSRLAIEVQLHDGVIVTHAAVQVMLERPGIAWPWRRLVMTRAIATMVRGAVATLQALLCEQAIAPPSLERLVAPVEAPAVVEVAAATPTAAPFERPAPRPVPPLSRKETLADLLRPRYPQTVTHLEAMGALDHLERIWQLEQGWARIMRGEYDAQCYGVEHHAQPGQATDFDLIYAGGGLGLLHAVVMATRYGRRVMVFDRSEVGCVHREWNISRVELQALVDLGVASWDELNALVMREYRDGVVRFHAGPTATAADLWLPDVLNVALDAGALVRLMRRKLEAAGGVVLNRRAFRRVRIAASDPVQVAVELETIAAPRLKGQTTKVLETYTARLLLDGMGSTSPLALRRHAGRPFAGVCPTVGTVAAGFVQGSGPREYDPTLGDILISIADAQKGEQLMWEGFPGRDDEMTIYLFYYSTIRNRLNGGANGAEAPRPYSLLDLFEQYFTLLPTYKQPGPDFRHVKPVYGFIPARHSLRRQEAPLLRGVLPVGDAAAQQSPLTFCGFGSHVRNLHRTTSLLDYALRRDLLAPEHLRHVNAFQTNVSLNWVFSRFMHPWNAPNDVNQLQNAFLKVLNELGVAGATRFFQDRMGWNDYLMMLCGMVRHYPIAPAAWRVLGVRGVLHWARDYLRFNQVACYAAVARRLGAWGETALSRIAERVSPTLGLRVRSRYAEWRAMGWV